MNFIEGARNSYARRQLEQQIKDNEKKIAEIAKTIQQTGRRLERALESDNELMIRQYYIKEKILKNSLAQFADQQATLYACREQLDTRIFLQKNNFNAAQTAQLRPVELDDADLLAIESLRLKHRAAQATAAADAPAPTLAAAPVAVAPAPAPAVFDTVAQYRSWMSGV